MWIIMAVLSAVFVAISAMLAKCGTQKTDPDVATTLRTIAVLCTARMAVGSLSRLHKNPPLTFAQAVHQPTAMLSQRFDRILYLTITIQLAYPFNGL